MNENERTIHYIFNQTLLTVNVIYPTEISEIKLIYFPINANRRITQYVNIVDVSCAIHS